MLGFSGSARAADIVVASSTKNINCGYTSDCGGNLGFSFTLSTGYTITKIRWTTDSSSASVISHQPPSTIDFDGTTFSINDIGSCGVGGTYDFTLPTPQTLSSGAHTLHLNYTGTADQSTIYGCSGSQPFHISAIALIAPEPTPSIAFDYPLTNASTTGDFPTFNLAVSNLSATSTGYSATVHYSRLSSSTPELSDSAALDFIDGGWEALISRSNVLWYPPLVAPVQYWAIANLVSPTSTVIATSSLITFYVDPNGTSTYGGGLSIPNATIASSTCSGFGFVGEPVCNAIVWLFVPPQGVFNLFTGLRSQLATKPPFGYFTSAQNALQNFSEGTSSVVLMDATTTSEFSTVFSPIKTGLAWVLWFAFGVWSFHRLRHFEF